MRFPLWASVMTFCGVLVLCALGGWQLSRLQWKTELLAQLDAAYAQDISQVWLERADFEDIAVRGDLAFMRGKIRGVYVHDKAIRIQSRVHDAAVGHHLVTPFIMAGGGVVLVNRGWVPQERDQDALISAPSGEVVLSGMVRNAQPPNMFTPLNDPLRGVWYSVQSAEIADAHGLEDVAASVFYLEEAEDRAQPYPVIAAARLSPSNNHAQYAFFWFAMAAVLVAVYALRFGGKAR